MRCQRDRRNERESVIIRLGPPDAKDVKLKSDIVSPNEADELELIQENHAPWPGGLSAFQGDPSLAHDRPLNESAVKSLPWNLSHL